MIRLKGTSGPYFRKLLWQHTLWSKSAGSQVCFIWAWGWSPAEHVAGRRNIACPLVNEVMDIEAQFMKGLLRKEMVIRPCLDVFLEECLYERYNFTSHSIFYPNLFHPHISNITQTWSFEQILCIALWFLGSSSFLYNIGDTEHIGEATVCQASRKVTLALKRLILVFVDFCGHKSERTIKEEFHRTAGLSLL